MPPAVLTQALRRILPLRHPSHPPAGSRRRALMQGSPKFRTYEAMTWSRHASLLALTRPSFGLEIDPDPAAGPTFGSPAAHYSARSASLHFAFGRSRAWREAARIRLTAFARCLLALPLAPSNYNYYRIKGIVVITDSSYLRSQSGESITNNADHLKW